MAWLVAGFNPLNYIGKANYQRGHSAQYSCFKLATSTYVLSIIKTEDGWTKGQVKINNYSLRYIRIDIQQYGYECFRAKNSNLSCYKQLGICLYVWLSVLFAQSKREKKISNLFASAIPEQCSDQLNYESRLLLIGSINPTLRCTKALITSLF